MKQAPYRTSDGEPPAPAAPPSRSSSDLGGLRLSAGIDRMLALKTVPAITVIPTIIVVWAGWAGGWRAAAIAFPFALALGAYMAPWFVSAVFRRVDLHMRGLRYRELGGRGTVLFDDVDEVRIEIMRGSNVVAATALDLREHGGAKHHIGIFGLQAADAHAVLQAVLKTCSEPLLPIAQQALERGETLRFGPATIDAVAIEVGQRRLPWGEMEWASLTDATFSFSGKPPNYTVIALDYSEVPHPTVFAELLRGLAPWRDGHKNSSTRS
ncbi:MAG: hypothetical protein HOW73_31580 [Polyangiaceae bacterium]|nr:hypothetical protein [Polyangiaceae bacterium]